ncbi:hypothetical protein [Rhodococcus phage REQ2]|uniref:Uncharacterized protein n=1 Tax=Rhodococcus phage REQ2 TaxID=1109713 RepID=G9FGY4_9CAUD|nr:transcriptional repressor [Rhodococcus phage REQ2]AEV51895.1 hypothetical protein [Rhodococcus phage REQ2]
MTRFRLSLDEVARVRRIHKIDSQEELARATDVSRSTWVRALKSGVATPAVLDALASLGARPDRILIADEESAQIPA